MDLLGDQKAALEQDQGSRSDLLDADVGAGDSGVILVGAEYGLRGG